MAPILLVLVLVIQSSFIYAADTDVPEDNEEFLQNTDVDDRAAKAPSDLPLTPLDPNWFDVFALPNNMFLSPSVSMMAHATNSNKTYEEQLKDIQEVAQQLADACESEMDRLYSTTTETSVKGIDENGARNKRSVETPMDSTRMVMRLLKHIKLNNEYQNIAIEKMMTAQEIAEKFGIEFNPDPEILSDLAMAANEHAHEMTNMLKGACDLKNITTEKLEFVPAVDEPKNENDNYYVYGIHPEAKVNEKSYVPTFEYMTDIVGKPQVPVNHIHYDSVPYYNYPYESQIRSPPAQHQCAPATPKPSAYDPFMYPFTPATDYYSPYCSVDSMMPTLLVPVDEPEPEPELVGEEVEETVTSKMIVERGEEPGATTVNHVTTYTISEKSHFKPPQIERLPQHFQYCFYLI